MFVCSDAGDSLNDCRIMFLTEIYKIEEPGSLSDAPAGPESPLKRRLKGAKVEFFTRYFFVANVIVRHFKLWFIIISSIVWVLIRYIKPILPHPIQMLYYNDIKYHIMKCPYSPGSNGPECKRCKDDPKKNCQWCNCHICGIKQDPDKQLLCDECDMAFHTYCLNPPLTSIPEDEDW